MSQSMYNAARGIARNNGCRVIDKHVGQLEEKRWISEGIKQARQTAIREVNGVRFELTDRRYKGELLPKNTLARRRFLNLWQRQGFTVSQAWQFIANEFSGRN